MAFSLKNWLEEAVAQVNPFDQGRTASTVRKERSDKPPAVTKPRAPEQSFAQKVKNVGTGIGLGAVRSATGTAQGLTGLVDLLSPGTGTNRFSKKLDEFARFTDQTAKNEGVGSIPYKGGQLATDILGFKGAGSVIKAASKTPAISKATQATTKLTAPLSTATNRTAVNVASRGAGGRILSSGLRAATDPSNITNMALNTSLGLGSESGKGRDITPTNALLSAGTGAALGIGLPVAGQTVREGVSAVKPLVRQGVDNATTRLVQPVYAHSDKQANTPLTRTSALDSSTTPPLPDAESFLAANNPMLPKAPKPELPEKLPTFETNKVPLIDKAFRSTRSIIERQGESGRLLASMLQGSRDTQEIFLGGLQKQLPTVRKLKGGDFENFVDATQGIAKPQNAKIARAVQEWQATHPQIRDRAVAAGLDVGDLGPGYYPHFIDYDRVFKDKNTYNEAINHLVKTGQAPTPEEAIKLLGYARDISRNREFGNLEASRLIDLPFYDKTPNSLISYLSGSAKRIAQTETFGAKDEKALELIKQIGLQGGDTEAAKTAYDIAVGAKRYSPTASKISQNIRRYVTTTRLGLGALTNVSQNVNTGVVTGHMRTLASAFKQLDPKTRAFVGDTGVIADAVLNDIRTQSGFASFGERAAGKVIDKITAPFFGTVEKLNRSISATAGRDYGLRLAQKGDEQTLRKLGVTGDIRNKTLTAEQQIQVARKVVEKTQFKVDPQDLPGWADSPAGKLVAQFRTFSYNQGKFVSNEILKPAAEGDLMPLARLLAALPLGYALYETKRVIAGRPEEENQTKVGLSAFQNVGGAGLAFDIYQSLNPIGSQYLPPDRRTTMALGAFGGPAAGIAAQGVGAVSEAVQRKNTPSDEERLEGKVVAANTGDTYTDLTALSRFGLQQVPIVGTAIKNRLLPYKKESDADTGKTGNVAINDAVNYAEETERKVSEALRTNLTEDENALRKLSKTERQYLIDGGVVSEEQFRRIDNKVESVRDKYGVGRKKDSLKIAGDKRGSELVNLVNDFNKEDREAWESKKLDTKYKDLYDRAQQIRFAGLPDLPQNNKVLSLYANLLEERTKGTTKLAENKAKLKFLKSAYKTDLPKETQEVLSASSDEIIGALERGDLTSAQVAEAIAYDDLLINAGLSTSQDIPNKVRRAIGLGDAPKRKSSSGKKRSSGGKKSGKVKTYDFSSLLAPSIKSSKTLRQLVKDAVISRK